MEYRIENDALGKIRVPAGAYYGSETERAKNNFRISGMHMQEEFISAYAMLKKAVAITNLKLGKLDSKIGNAIVKASDEVIKGKLQEQFVVDVFQAGAGTSVNMNLNEVIANRALEILGRKKGDYSIIHPNDHVNMSQSTNDTFHCAIHISADIAIKNELLPSLSHLSKELKKKANEFSKIVKIGRTHLQDAVPITLGDEFSGYYGLIDEMIDNINFGFKSMQKIPIGGTAVGTGINTPKGYAKNAAKEISDISGIRFYPEKNIFSGMQNQKEELLMSGMLRSTAISLNKISNDIRLLGSGPRAGIREIILPPVQPGSSIMPGKINPSMAEMLNMVCFQSLGNCTAIDEAANAGQLELNVFMPIIAFNLLFTIRILSNGINSFTQKCVSGITPNKEKMAENLERNLSLATALSPYIGYAKAAEMANKAYKENRTIKEVCIDEGILDKKSLDRILKPENLV